MAAINETMLKKQIKENAFAKVYFFYGEETYLVEKYSELVVSKVVGKTMVDFNLQRFDGKVPVNTIAEAVEALPLMAERKCVLVTDFDAEGLNAAENKKLNELIENLPNSCVLVFRILSLEINLKKSAKWKNFLKLVDKAGDTLIFDYRTPAALAKYLSDYAEKRGCALSQEDGKYLVQQCGTELILLNNEMEKLCAYVGEGTITRKQIDSIAVKTAETVTYKLANSLVAGNYEEAYRILSILFDQREEPVSILSALSGAYIDLYRAKAALESGVPIPQAAQDFEYRSLEFKLRNAAKDCRRLKLSQLRRCLDAIYQTDKQLKSSRTDSRVLLEKLLAQLLLISVKG